MDIFDKLLIDKNWEYFYEYKEQNKSMRKKDLNDLRSFIDNKEYLQVVDDMINGRDFGLPEILEINKNGTSKKRIVFTFDREHNYVLKLVAYLMREYDYIFSDNLYSFRKNTGVKHAIHNIINSRKISTSYTYKADIHDYFNSIKSKDMVEKLLSVMPNEKRLISLLETLWNCPYAMKKGTKIKIVKGVMAGTPTAGFMANLYLSDMDKWFADKCVLYARYSDDVIVFADSFEDITEYENIINKNLLNRGLTINSQKVSRTKPGDNIEFLGFDFCNRDINISKISAKKIKAKMRRKTYKLYAWKLRKNAENERTAKAFIRYFNEKFYDNPIRNEITWCRWYFPMITRADKLKELDEYAVQCIRYLYTGRHSKKNYNLRYSDIKKLGYQSLVNNYWKFKKGKYEHGEDNKYNN